MLRILLTVLLPIALPLLLYLAYMKYVRPQRPPGAAPEAAPGAASGTPGAADPDARRKQLAFWIALGASVLMVAGTIALGLSRGVPPGTRLISPHMKDGEIVPSQQLEPAR